MFSSLISQWTTFFLLKNSIALVICRSTILICNGWSGFPFLQQRKTSLCRSMPKIFSSQKIYFCFLIKMVIKPTADYWVLYLCAQITQIYDSNLPLKHSSPMMARSNSRFWQNKSLRIIFGCCWRHKRVSMLSSWISIWITVLVSTSGTVHLA